MTIVEQIVNREIEAVIIYESTDVIAFADHDPINLGHILICPTYPYESYIDVPENVLFEIHWVAKDLYKRIEDAFKPDGISFIQNNGKFNELSHYHLHIFPRFNDDQFGWQSRGLGVQSIDKLRESLARL
ncbi:HIT family protein [Vibrio diazotrophicus]|uniref:HIT family protein n=1 Tax=Vibrio diazotrophicus TaxID=685 RepID=A0A2J8HQ67_VIBDI|nr:MULTISPECIES: HIT family protein [Vibrio]MCF7364563.1 HIT family protein [Vibrio sp. A1-b2]PNI00412.1 HIT family protein [Vibrio diazotrophicus]